MMIRQDFQNESTLPPRMFLEQVMDSLSKAYCFLWDKKNDDNRIRMTWKDVTRYYNKNAFRSNIRKLNNEGLLSYTESEDDINIELVGWDDIED